LNLLQAIEKYVNVPSMLYNTGVDMAEKKVDELLKKYLGISAPRIIIAILMILFGVIIILKPEMVGLLIGIYLLISGILALIDELIKGRAVKLLK
jgi:uncharacterized membrane protein HdeD (DUF308 family)